VDVTRPDLTDLALYASGEIFEVWKQLRATAPIIWQEESSGPGFWAVTRYSDVVSLLRRSDGLTSERGMILGVNRGRGDPAAGKMLVVTDPPRHTHLRRLVAGPFSSIVLKRMASTLDQLVAELLDRLPAEKLDFVEEVAAPLPVAAITRLMGIPRSDERHLYELTRVAFGSSDEEYQTQSSKKMTATQAHFDLFDYFARLLREKRRLPDEHLVSLLAVAEVEGIRLTDEEILVNCLNLILGGNETTRHAASGGLLALLETPDEFARLQARPDLLPVAVEEILRWTSPAMHVLRTATNSFALSDVTVREGDAVTLWIASANRDDDEFGDGARFRIERTPNRHIAFGLGEHRCIGSSLARLELSSLFSALLARPWRIQLTGPAVRLRSNFIGGLKHLTVAVA
jgi:cytochrome P450